jgi:hypothetical protein
MVKRVQITIEFWSAQPLWNPLPKKGPSVFFPVSHEVKNTKNNIEKATISFEIEAMIYSIYFG